MATVRGHYRFTVKERSNGSPWLAAEPAGDIIPGMGDLGFDLDHGTTLEQAHALANAMNSRIRRYTSMRGRAIQAANCRSIHRSVRYRPVSHRYASARLLPYASEH